MWLGWDLGGSQGVSWACRVFLDLRLAKKLD